VHGIRPDQIPFDTPTGVINAEPPLLMKIGYELTAASVETAIPLFAKRIAGRLAMMLEEHFIRLDQDGGTLFSALDCMKRNLQIRSRKSFTLKIIQKPSYGIRNDETVAVTI